MRVLLTLAGLTALALGWSKLRDVRLRGAFEDALAWAAEAESPDTSRGRVADDNSRLTLRVLSYNVWALPVPLPGLDRRARLPRIPAALSAEGADIIALQEAFDVRFREFVASYLAVTHRAHASILCQQSLGLGVRTGCSGGLATLVARFPVTEQRFEPHPPTEDMRWDERKGGKGFMVSVLRTPVGPVHVLNVHLYAGRAPEDEAIRLTQIRNVAKALEARGSLDRPLVLLGDLNVVHPSLSSDGAASPTFAFLVDSLGFVDAAPASVGSRFTYDAETNPYANLWYNRFEKRQIFDYVMVRLPAGFELEMTEGRVLLVGEDALSDHFAVFSELTISTVDTTRTSRLEAG